MSIAVTAGRGYMYPWHGRHVLPNPPRNPIEVDSPLCGEGEHPPSLVKEGEVGTRGTPLLNNDNFILVATICAVARWVGPILAE